MSVSDKEVASGRIVLTSKRIEVRPEELLCQNVDRYITRREATRRDLIHCSESKQARKKNSGIEVHQQELK